MRTTLYQTAALAVAALFALSACSGSTEPEPTTPAPTPTTSAPVEEVDPTPTQEATPEPDPVPTEVGENVPADQVEAAREAGASVYVSPNGDGDGIVIDPEADLTPIVGDDMRATGEGKKPASLDAFLDAGDKGMPVADAITDAGGVVFHLVYAADFEADGSVSATQYRVAVSGIRQRAKEFHQEAGDTRRSTKEAAIAAIRPLMDEYPNATFLDLTE